jgi:hypothetical protein
MTCVRHTGAPSPLRSGPREHIEENAMRLFVAMTFCLAALGTGVLPAGAQGLSLTSDRPAYNVGDTPVFTITAKQDCLLTLVAINAHGTPTVLLPNRFQPDNLIKSDTSMQLPPRNAIFFYRLNACGTERIIATCTPPKGVEGRKREVAEISFTVSPPARSPETQ